MDDKHWLARFELEHLASQFDAQSITIDHLPDLTESHLLELGLSIGDRVRLKRAVDVLNDSSFNVKHPKAQLRQVTVLFCDLVGSSALSEQLTPEQYLHVITEYQQTVNNSLIQYGAYVISYIGDGILAVFGYPKASEDSSDRAIRSALDTVKAVATIKSFDNITLAARVGISTGEAVVGAKIGQGITEQLSVTGSNTNFAARLQSEASPGQVVISQSTLNLTRSAMQVVPLHNLKLKGFSELVTAYVVTDIQPIQSTRITGNKRILEKNTPLLSRAEEIQLLKRVHNHALLGEGQLVFVTGDPGIGKSRLIDEFIETIDKVQVIRCQSRQLYANTAIYPIISSLRQLFNVNDLNNNRQYFLNKIARKLNISTHEAEIFTDLILSSIASDYSSVEVDTNKVYQASLKLLGQWLEKSPIVIVIEDIHWADPTSLKYIENIAPWIADRKILIIASSRLTNQLEIIQNRNVSQIILSRLSKTSSIEFVEMQANASLITDHGKDLIVQRADGVPLYLEELTKSCLVDVKQRGTDDKRVIPATLRDLLMSRIDGLGELSEIVQIASVFDGPFTAAQLSKVARLSQQYVESCLQNMVNQHVFVLSIEHVTQLYEFGHELVREAAYHSLLDRRKKQLHGAIALELYGNTIPESEYESAAIHYEHADRIEKAIELWELAGNRADRQSANFEAEKSYRRAIRLLEKHLDSKVHSEFAKCELKERRMSLNLRLATQLVACHGNGSKKALACFESARQLASSTTSAAQKFQALYGFLTCKVAQGDLFAVKKNGEDLLRLAATTGKDEIEIVAFRAYGWFLVVMGEFAQGERYLDRSIEKYKADGYENSVISVASDPLVLAYCNMALVKCFQGDKKISKHHSALSIRYARRIENTHSLAFSIAITTVIHQLMGEVYQSRALSLRLRALSRANYFHYWKAWAEIMQGWSLAVVRDKTGFALLDKGIESYISTGATMFLPYFETLYAHCCLKNDMEDMAATKIERAIELSNSTGVRFYEAETYRLKNILSKYNGDLNAHNKAIDICLKQGNTLIMNRLQCR